MYSKKIHRLEGTLNSKLFKRKRKETGGERREKERKGERERREREESSCTRAETFSNYKRRHSRAARRRLFLKQEYSSPPRDIMRKREARSEGAIMAAVMKKSTHPGAQPPPSHPDGRATLVTHLIFRFHSDRLVQRTPAGSDRRGWQWQWWWW